MERQSKRIRCSYWDEEHGRHDKRRFVFRQTEAEESRPGRRRRERDIERRRGDDRSDSKRRIEDTRNWRERKESRHNERVDFRNRNCSAREGRSGRQTVREHRSGRGRCQARARQQCIALNKRLAKGRSVQDLLGIISEAWDNGISPDAVNISTALHRMAKFSKSIRFGRERRNLANDPRVQRLEFVHPSLDSSLRCLFSL